MANGTSRYHYTIGAPIRGNAGPATSSTEVLHITVAFFVLTFDFLLLFGGVAFYQAPLLLAIATAAAAAFTGFVAHELAHKISAENGGYWAEFRLSPLGLFISVLTASFGFLFAAPGATRIGGMSNVRDWGRTALAGPATNFGFALAFLAGSFATSTDARLATVSTVLLFLAYINAWFAAFNMIPFGPLDGAKVFRWSKGIWAGSFVVFAAVAGVLFFTVNLL